MPETALRNLPAANEPTAAEPRAQFSTVEAAREFYQRPPCWSGSSNLWGSADVVFGGLQGLRVGLDPGALGAAFFLPTAIVPALLVTHFLTFRLLVRTAGPIKGFEEYGT